MIDSKEMMEHKSQDLSQVQTLHRIFFFAGCFVFLMALVALFNLSVDPMCYYRCESVDLQRKSQNVYYRSAQTAAANPDAEILILGSSRGERVSPRWVESVTGLKSINLSQGGADVFLKVALINIALEKNPKIKKVIWMADYFELVPISTDIKTRLTPILFKYSGLQASGLSRGGLLEQIQGLIDHRTFEAGLDLIGKNSAETFRKAGNGSEIDYLKCLSPDFVGPTPADKMDKVIGEAFAGFASGWSGVQDPLYWDIFEKEIRSLSDRGIEVIINLAPYNPVMFERVLKEIPSANQNRKTWSERIQKLAGPKVKVLRFENGIPGDDGGPRYWEDGAHPTCFGVIEMLKAGLGNK